MVAPCAAAVGHRRAARRVARVHARRETVCGAHRHVALALGVQARLALARERGAVCIRARRAADCGVHAGVPLAGAPVTRPVGRRPCECRRRVRQVVGRGAAKARRAVHRVRAMRAVRLAEPVHMAQRTAAVRRGRERHAASRREIPSVVVCHSGALECGRRWRARAVATLVGAVANVRHARCVHARRAIGAAAAPGAPLGPRCATGRIGRVAPGLGAPRGVPPAGRCAGARAERLAEGLALGTRDIAVPVARWRVNTVQIAHVRALRRRLHEAGALRGARPLARLLGGGRRRAHR